MIYGLTRGSPKDFVFAAKLPKLITHTKKLNLDKGVQADLEKFLELMKPMNEAGKLGPLLIQLPPEFSFSEIETLSRFLALLPESYRFAVEFRNVSWLRDETWALLRKHNVAYTIVDEPLLPPKTVFTADFAYFRWHGRHSQPWFDYRYSEKELDEWVPKVKEAAEKTRKVYGTSTTTFTVMRLKTASKFWRSLARQRASKPRFERRFRTTSLGNRLNSQSKRLKRPRRRS
jgi:uncharacterized protein YecE (DUF72 family)